MSLELYLPRVLADLCAAYADMRYVSPDRMYLVDVLQYAIRKAVLDSGNPYYNPWFSMSVRTRSKAIITAECGRAYNRHKPTAINGGAYTVLSAKTAMARLHRISHSYYDEDFRAAWRR